MKDWTLIVAGDKKTPANYSLKNGIYISPEMQEKYDKKLSDLIGWNSIQRRNFAFLWAKDLGADIIALVDDDNIPLDNWGKNLFVGNKVKATVYETDLPMFDPVGATNYPHLWHRGYPVQFLRKRDYSKKQVKEVKCDIQADFWQGDPDIDAICRIEHAPNCAFDPSFFPLTSDKPAPFNSQNTFITKDVLEHYFVMPHVGRMDDIWAGFHVLSLGFKVVFSAPSVTQLRNEHDLTKDLVKEFIGYQNNYKIAEQITQKDIMFQYLPEQTQEAFKAYRQHFK